MKNNLFELGMCIIAFISAVPILMMILGSFKSAEEAAVFGKLLPEKWVFGNYAVIMHTDKFLSSFFNSVIITFFPILIITVFASVASFVIARKNDKTTNTIYKIFLSGLVAPMMYIPTIQTLQFLHLMNTRTGIILIYTAISIPLSIFLFTGFIKGTPKELDESAFVDGCSFSRMFFIIIFPLLLPVIFTNVIITFMGIWNDLNNPLFFLNSSSKWTLPMLVFNFVSKYVRNWNLVYAYLTVTSLPVVIVFIIAQRYMLAGLTAGSVKG